MWTPEKAIIEIPNHGVKYPRLFIRTGNYSSEETFTNVLTSYFPNAPKPNFADGQSFVNLLGNLTLKPDGIVLAIIEATVVIKSLTCIKALRDGLRIAKSVDGLSEKVIPVVIVGDMAHTGYFDRQKQNPDGPKQVVEESRALGAITVQVTPDTLRERITYVIEEILKGKVPSVSSF